MSDRRSTPRGTRCGRRSTTCRRVDPDATRSASCPSRRSVRARSSTTTASRDSATSTSRAAFRGGKEPQSWDAWSFEGAGEQYAVLLHPPELAPDQLRIAVGDRHRRELIHVVGEVAP